MDETGAELPKVNTELVQKPEGNVVTRLVSNLRRALSKTPQNTTSTTPQELTPDQKIAAEKAKIQASQDILGQIQMDPRREDIKIGDAEKTNIATANRNITDIQINEQGSPMRGTNTYERPWAEKEAQSTAVPVAPNEQQPPAEEPAAA